MRNLGLLMILAFILGSVNYLDAQERQDREQQERQQQEGMQRDERAVEVTDLPQEVQEKLREDYEDWRPVDASMVTDPEEHEESFYQVRMHDPEDQETKIILISRDGEVLDEKDDDEGLFDRDRDRDREEDRRTPRRHGEEEEYTPAAYQERQQEQQEQERQEGMERQQRSVGVADLPEEVQEKLREDYEEFNATDAVLVTDFEEHEESFFQIRLQDRENEETKIVMITRDGEVLDEKDDDNEGLFEREEEERDDRRRRRGY